MLKRCTRTLGSREPETIQYLWVHLADEVFIPPQFRNGSASEKDLSLEEWYNVIDEAASLGAESVILSIGAPLAQKPEVWPICEWAQNVHDMRVGIYVSNGQITEDDVRRMAQLNKDKTRLFVDSTDLDRLRYADEQYGIQLCIADGFGPDEPQTECHLPESMSCVCSKGKLYTCGLVLGNQRFHMGHINRKRLDGVMTDESLPHSIPEGAVPASPNRCNACPPLMERRMRGMRGH
jgi:hypothetical protein